MDMWDLGMGMAYKHCMGAKVASPTAASASASRGPLLTEVLARLTGCSEAQVPRRAQGSMPPVVLTAVRWWALTEAVRLQAAREKPVQNLALSGGKAEDLLHRKVSVGEYVEV
eukprot:788257-Rhodomonas_salina.1